MFVELHELDSEEMQWNEKARWIKFEENVEEATGHWGKPHVANLSFLQLIELRKYLETGKLSFYYIFNQVLLRPCFRALFTLV